MGHIYSQAQTVIAWMGDDPHVAAFLRGCLSSVYTERQPSDQVNTEHSCTHIAIPCGTCRFCFDVDWTVRQYDLIKHFCNHAYWKRAWITQELLLGRKVHLLAQRTVLPFAKHKPILFRKNSLKLHMWMRMLHHDSYTDLTRLDHVIKELSGERRFHGVIDNLELYGDKFCSDARDVIYSLIAVSVDGAKLRVDYDCSLVQLARDVLRLEQGRLCIWRAHTVIRALIIHISPLASDAATFLIDITTQRLRSLQHTPSCEQCGVEHSLGAQQ